MDDAYTTGVVVAAVIGAVKIAITSSILLSLRARNMSKVGYHYHTFTGQFLKQKPMKGSFIFFILYVLVFAPIFSWLSVISAAWGYIAAHTNKSPVPDKLKEIQFKIANVDLPKDKVIELVSETAALLGVPPEIDALDPDSDDGDPNTLVLESGDWYRDITVDASKFRYMMNSHPDDYGIISDIIWEYKIEGSKVFERVIEDKTKTYTEEYWDVKDNVVLEADMRKRNSEEKFAFRSVDETIENTKAACQWHELTYYKVRYFILSKHPDLVPLNELRRLIRTELESFRTNFPRFCKVFTEKGGKVIEGEERFEFRFSDGQSESSKKELSALFEPEALSEFGLPRIAIDEPKKYEADLLRWLGESPREVEKKSA